MLTFVKINVNPKGVMTNDCVTRAISTASGIPYKDVWQGLLRITDMTGYSPNDPHVYEQYLRDIGYTKRKKPFKPSGKTYRAIEATAFLEPGTSAVLRVAHHLVAVKNNNLVDSWNSGLKSVYGYWVKPTKPLGCKN